MYEKTLIWWTPWCAGGIGDRLLGMITAYCIAKRTGRDFLIKWDCSDLSSVIPMNQKYNYYAHQVPYTEIINSNVENMTYFETVDIEKAWPQHVLIWSNFNIFVHFCKKYNIPRQEYVKEYLDAVSCIFTEIFHPIPEVYELIPKGIETSVGIHIRTHDNQFESEENKVKQIPYIRDILERCKKHMDSLGTAGGTVFIASDCSLTVSLAKEIFGDSYTILSTSGTILHCGTNKDFDKSGVIRVFADLLSLSRCSSLYLGWNTNFSRIGYLLNAYRRAYTFEYPEKPREIYECSLGTWLDYFSIGGRS